MADAAPSTALPTDFVPEAAASTGEPGFRNRIVGFGEVDPSQLLSNPGNWRVHSTEQKDALAAVLDRVGWVSDIVVNRRTGFVVDGHARVQVALQRNEATVPVKYVDLTDEEEKIILATLDPIAGMAGTDDALLRELMEQITTEGDEVRAVLDGIAEAEHLDFAEPVRSVDEDDVPDPPAVPVTKRGDLWKLGAHRLLCGDATNVEDVIRLMDGHRAKLLHADPPYGVAYANDDRPNPGVAKPRVAKPRVAKDDLHDEVLQTFLEAAFRLAVDHALEPDAAWYLWHAHLTQGFFAAAAAAAAADVVLSRQIIWVKPVLLLTRGQYHWKHEPCFFGWVRGHQPPDYGRGKGERDQTTVWEVESVARAERKEFNHSTPKPVGLFTGPLIKHLRPGEVAYDPFCGTGPQLIAAEETGRRCFAMDIDPAYCDVIIARWERMTGLKAELVAPEAVAAVAAP